MFKTYPFGVLHAMVHLQKTMNISLTYHIAGDGPLLDSIKEMVSKLGLENSVVFHGKIPYSSVNELIQDACCFIGTGTAVGEAAGIGVPALVAIAYDAGHTYGLLGNLPPNILGESGEDLPLISFSDALSHIYQLPSGVYEEERRKSAEKAGFYDVKNVAKLLVKAFEAAVPGIPLKINLLQRIMYYIARVQIRLFSKRGYKFK